MWGKAVKSALWYDLRPKLFDASGALFIQNLTQKLFPDMTNNRHPSELSVRLTSAITLHSRLIYETLQLLGGHKTKTLQRRETARLNSVTTCSLYCIATQETPHGNFGIFPIVPKGEGGFHMEVGNARKWQAFFVDYLKINLWVLASLSTAKQKLEIRREDYGLKNPSMAFSLSYVSCCNLSRKYIFVFSVLETCHQSFS